MEPRSALLRGIAGLLNAGGSALLDIYDAATSIKTSMLPGKKGKLKTQLREYEKKIERLYYEIGKEVALREYTGQMSAAAEAGIKLVAEHRVKTERIKQCIREIEEKEKAATKTATDRAGAKAEPAADTGKPAASEAPVASEVSTGVVTEEVKERVAEAAETQAQEIDMGAPESAAPEAGEVPTVVVTEEIKDIPAGAETPGEKMQMETAESGAPAPVASESSPGAETKQEAVPEELETMPKSELLKLCTDRGIDADQRMTKAAIIELIKKKQI